MKMIKVFFPGSYLLFIQKNKDYDYENEVFFSVRLWHNCYDGSSLANSVKRAKRSQDVRPYVSVVDWTYSITTHGLLRCLDPLSLGNTFFFFPRIYFFTHFLKDDTICTFQSKDSDVMDRIIVRRSKTMTSHHILSHWVICSQHPDDPRSSDHRKLQSRSFPTMIAAHVRYELSHCTWSLSDSNICPFTYLKQKSRWWFMISSSTDENESYYIDVSSSDPTILKYTMTKSSNWNCIL